MWCCCLLQVVVPQGVLVRASAELTVTQALEIADMTLETSCRAIQWALNVPEVLMASAGENEEAVACRDPHLLQLAPSQANTGWPRHRAAVGCCKARLTRERCGVCETLGLLHNCHHTSNHIVCVRG